MPPENHYHTDLKPQKWFTITHLCDYESPWTNVDHVFLKYKVKDGVILKLKDIREDTSPNTYTEPDNIDGYLHCGDNIEICLLNPSELVEEEYEKINFSQNKCEDICRCKFNITGNVKDIEPSYCEILLNNSTIKTIKIEPK